MKEFKRPQISGEDIVILGPKPEGWDGLGATTGDILVQYPPTPAAPEGEVGAVSEDVIREASP